MSHGAKGQKAHPHRCAPSCPSAIDDGKSAHHRCVIQRFFHRRVARGVPLPQEVDAQHGCQRIRLTAAAARNRVVRLDQRQQSLQRHNLIHRVEEQLPARFLALAQAFGIADYQPHGAFNVI